MLTDEALKFITVNRAKPFFCYVAYNTPHSPYQVPDKYFDKFKAKGFDDTVAAFYGMCENLDDNVGRLLAHLESQQLAEDTIVLFLTDNGGTAGVKLYNAGMRGGKTSVHEGGTRVPLLIRWPAAKWQPHPCSPIASHIDLYPTLLDLCAVKAPAGPKLDGASLRPLLEGRDHAWPDRVLFTHNPIDETNKFPGAVRTQRYRLVREIKGPAGGSKAKANDSSATRWQLYDMQADPGEKQDIAADHPELVQQLAAAYDAWFADVSRDGLRRFALPVGHTEHNPVELHAPQAYFDTPLVFANGPGFANDWLTGWTDVKAKVWFEIEVATAGVYDVELDYGCPPADAGAKIRLIILPKSREPVVQAELARNRASAGDPRSTTNLKIQSIPNQSLEATLPAAPSPEIPLPHRDEKGKKSYRNRAWQTLQLGTLHLEPGPAKLTLEPLAMPGSQVMDFKQVRLRLRKD